MFSLPPFNYSVDYSGTKLEGIVEYCSASDVSVTITKPYNKLHSSLHTMYCCMFPFNRNLDGQNNLSEKGKDTISNILISIYEKADFLYKNRELLYERISRYERNIQGKLSELDELKKYFSAEKSKNKMLLKHRGINTREYSAFLKDYSEKISQEENFIRNSKQQIFSGFPDFQICYGEEDQSIMFVKEYF